MKNAFEESFSRLDLEKASVWVNRNVPNRNAKRKKMKKKNNIQGLWDSYKRCDIYIWEHQEKRERSKEKI